MKRDLALLGVVQDQPLLLQIWLHYYLDHGIEPSNIFMIDTSSTAYGRAMVRELQKHYKYNVISLPMLRKEDEQVIHLITRFQHFLSDIYDCVMHATASEILVPDNDQTLIEICDNLEDNSCIVCKSYDVIRSEGEGEYDRSRPVLTQRKRWLPMRKFNRPVVCNTNLLPDTPRKSGSGLILIRLVDYEKLVSSPRTKVIPDRFREVI